MARILIVEDDIDQLNIRKQLLEQAGYQVATAQNATEAITQLPGSQVVLMDLRLPEPEDGMELILAASPSARIIVLSGAEPEAPLPVDAFLTKPFSSKKLLEIVAKFCPVEPASE
jgi:two-component system, OmpR family, response regulator VanR